MTTIPSYICGVTSCPNYQTDCWTHNPYNVSSSYRCPHMQASGHCTVQYCTHYAPPAKASNI